MKQLKLVALVMIVMSVAVYFLVPDIDFQSGECITPTTGWERWQFEAPILKITSRDKHGYKVASWRPRGWFNEDESLNYAGVNQRQYKVVSCPDAHNHSNDAK